MILSYLSKQCAQFRGSGDLGAPVAHYSVWSWQKWLKGSCQEMWFYLPQTGAEQSWQQQHLHLTRDGLDQDKWNYVFLSFCQAPYLSESMQLSPPRGEREEMWVQPLQVNSNWTPSILPFRFGIEWNFLLTGRICSIEGAAEITARQLSLKPNINSVTACAFLSVNDNISLEVGNLSVDTVELSVCTWNLVI